MTAGFSSVLNAFDCSGETAIISGGGRGLGCYTANALLELGADVYCFDILPEPDANDWKRASETASKNGSVLKYMKVDVTKDDVVDAAVQQVAQESRYKIAMCVASAGICEVIDAVDYPIAKVRRLMDINVIGCYSLATSVARVMIDQGTAGRIALVASMSGHIANKGSHNSAYCVSKAGLIQMARSFAVEWGKSGIRINTISPGYMRGALLEEFLVKNPNLEDEINSQCALGRMGTYDEIKTHLVYMVSKASSFMTGSDVLVDGGHCSW